MTIESKQPKIDSSKAAEPTQVLLATAREKYTRYMQRRQRDGNQAVSQTTLPAIPVVLNAKQYITFRNLVSQVMLSATPEVSVVVPTRNEHENIWPLLESLQDALRGLHVEVIFVDDSDDDTPGVIEDAARTLGSSLFRIELEHRLAGSARAGRLASAVVQGMNRARAGYVAVIDADLQHPPEQLRVLYDQAVAQHADLVLASRYIQGGSYRGLAGVGRRCISVGLKWTAKLLFPEQLLRVSDP